MPFAVGKLPIPSVVCYSMLAVFSRSRVCPCSVIKIRGHAVIAGLWQHDGRSRMCPNFSQGSIDRNRPPVLFVDKLGSSPSFLGVLYCNS